MRQKMLPWLCTSLLLTLGLAAKMAAQSPNDNLFGQALFRHNIYNIAGASPDSSQLDFYITFVNDILQFVQVNDSLFHASYELSVAILDKKNVPILDKFVTGNFQAKSFAETNSRVQGVRHKFSFNVQPGDYTYHLQLTDGDTKQNLIRTGALKARSFKPGLLHLSDIMFVDRIRRNESGQLVELDPNLQDLFKEPESEFLAIFLCYPGAGSDSVYLTQTITTLRDELVDRKTTSIPANSQVTTLVIPIKDRIDMPGRYWLKIKARQGRLKVEMERRFVVEWNEMRVAESNVEMVLEQLKIIADARDIKEIRDAPKERQLMLFDAFWQKRDPTPETPENELQLEFFRRIDFANRNFVTPFTRRDGWQSDRGRIYIKYGEPAQVEKQPTELNQPAYEIWYYAKINRRFIFSDPSGTGSYRLVRME